MWGAQFEHLDIYYEDCVIGGPGAFVIGIRAQPVQGDDPHQAGDRVAGHRSRARRAFAGQGRGVFCS
jgi:hypothetical protein